MKKQIIVKEEERGVLLDALKNYKRYFAIKESEYPKLIELYKRVKKWK